MKLDAGNPLMLYDGDCLFCKRWIEKWRKATGSGVDYEPYQQALKDHLAVSEKECVKAVQLIMPDGKVYSGAHAVFKALHAVKKMGWLLWAYEHLWFFGGICELFYQLVARNREFLLKICREPIC